MVGGWRIPNSKISQKAFFNWPFKHNEKRYMCSRRTSFRLPVINNQSINQSSFLNVGVFESGLKAPFARVFFFFANHSAQSQTIHLSSLRPTASIPTQSNIHHQRALNPSFRAIETESWRIKILLKAEKRTTRMLKSQKFDFSSPRRQGSTGHLKKKKNRFDDFFRRSNPQLPSYFSLSSHAPFSLFSFFFFFVFTDSFILLAIIFRLENDAKRFFHCNYQRIDNIINSKVC